MESNGFPGRIHISGATAEELNRHGKGNWYTPRPDKIQAKGKGEMQTYFVTIGGAGSATTRNTSKGDSTDGCTESSPELLDTLEEASENPEGGNDAAQLERQLADYMGKQDKGSQSSQNSGNQG